MNTDSSVNTRHKPKRHSRINKANVTEKGWKESNAREKNNRALTEAIQKKKGGGGGMGWGCVWESRPDGWDPACFSIIHALSPLSSYETYTYTHALAHSSVQSLFQIKCRKMGGGLQCSLIAKENLLLLGPPPAHIAISTDPLFQSDDSFI